MSQNIFDATLDPNNDVKVNNFDWSHANNLTTQIGRITPIFCDMVPSKTSFRVNPRFGLQFMPMVFPIQTRMKARIMWFRYPLRALWKDYKDFVGNFREGLEEPYINFDTEARLRRMASTGSLGDYLGLPSTLVGNYGVGFSYDNFDVVNFRQDSGLYTYDISDNQGVFAGSRGVYDASSFLANLEKGMSFEESDTLYLFPFPDTSNRTRIIISKAVTWSGLIPSYASVGDVMRVSIGNIVPNKFLTFSSISAIAVSSSSDNIAWNLPVNISIDGSSCNIDVSYISELLNYSKSHSDVSIKFYLIFNPFSSIGQWIQYNGSIRKWDVQLLSSEGVTIAPSNGNNLSAPWSLFLDAFKNAVVNSVDVLFDSSSVRDLTLDSSPWYNSKSPNKDKQQKILAYGFRAYEGIYNSFIRDNRNNPYYLNGQVQYNRWIPNDEGGEDNELYELRYANWEKDFLTTAVQSPQQGNAPLVGITTYTQTVANEDGTNTELIKTALVDEDGKKYGLSFKTSDDGLEGVEYIELDNGTQVRQARSLYDLATSGISIPDLRMVNCYQKFLELNMRKGYSYKDIVEGRFDVKVRYADLLMPEFFGGVSRDIDVNSVTQTVDNNAVSGSGDYATALGSQSGIAGVRGEANANIECFCDEESIIMGLLIVTPLPVYTQLLPKHFTYRGLMEHFQPEFNLIGFQPIKYNEVCPIQAYNDNPKTLTETFGYNRPWYEFAQKYDVAHGLFRTSLSNFLMHRVFDKKPELAQSFLIVDPEQVTDVFSVTETTDKIYGQIWLDITCKLPIARVAIPRLD
jgi:hypothetical protein